MVQIADVLAREGLSIDDERECVLEVGADAEHRTARRQRRDRARRIATRVTKHDRTIWTDGRYRVVDAARDFAFADQECVGDAAETIRTLHHRNRRLVRSNGSRSS